MNLCRIIIPSTYQYSTHGICSMWNLSSWVIRNIQSNIAYGIIADGLVTQMTNASGTMLSIYYSSNNAIFNWEGLFIFVINGLGDELALYLGTACDSIV